MKYSAMNSLKYVINGLSKREKWMFAGTFLPFAIAYFVQSYSETAWGVVVSNDKLMWEFLSIAFLASWLLLLVTLAALSKEREQKEGKPGNRE